MFRAHLNIYSSWWEREREFRVSMCTLLCVCDSRPKPQPLKPKKKMSFCIPYLRIWFEYYVHDSALLRRDTSLRVCVCVLRKTNMKILLKIANQPNSFLNGMEMKWLWVGFFIIFFFCLSFSLCCFVTHSFHEKIAFRRKQQAHESVLPWISLYCNKNSAAHLHDSGIFVGNILHTMESVTALRDDTW